MLLLVVGGASFCGVMQGYASKTDLVTVASEKQSRDPTLVLTQGMAEIVDVEGAVSDIMVANPSIVDVMALQSNRLYVVGVTLGSTNVIAVDAEGNIISRLNVHVKIDDLVIQDVVDELFPEESVKIQALMDQVIVSGRVSTPSVAESVMDIVSQYVGEIQGEDGTADELIVNMLKVSGENQVMLRVKIIEASREVLRELGVETNLTQLNNVGNLTGTIGTAIANGLTTDPFAVASLIYDTGSSGFGPLQTILRALEEDGLVNTLAEPNLTAVSGETAGFLAGGETPVPTSRDRDGNIIVEYRPFGVSLNFRPVVLSGDLISLHLQTEVSAVSNQSTFNIQGLDIPSFTVRRAETTVEMGSGSSLMIAGLLKSEVAKSMTGMPGVKNLPVLGELFSSESFQREETELVVIVTPYLVHPYADKSFSKELPIQESNPLAAAFADNIKRTFAKFSLASDLFAQDERYGYLID